MNNLNQLIRYALDQGALREISAEDGERAYRLGNRTYRLTRSGDGYVDTDGLTVTLKRELPITEVIDLIHAAAECGVISDGTPERKLLDYGGDYLEICRSHRVFIFCVVSLSGEGKTFKTVFSPEDQDGENGIEYAHRASALVDILVKRIMNKFGVLYSDSILGEAETTVVAPPPLHRDVVLVGRELLKTEKRTTEPMAQIKALIRYRDTAGGSAFVRNIIDEIYLYVSGIGEIEWSFPKIFIDGESAGERMQTSTSCRVVTVDERKKAEALMRVIESPWGKRAMFTALKDNESSALYGLIQSRKADYASSDVLPKVEFSITPLAMYCSYPLLKTLTYTLALDPEITAGNRFLSGFETEYSLTFPDSLIGEYWVDCDGRRVRLTEKNPLVIAFTNDFTREKYPKAVPAPLDHVTALGKLNPEYYGSAEIENAFFLNSEIVTGATLDGLSYPKELPFLRSDVKRCLVDGGYYHVRDLIKVDAAVKDGAVFTTEEGGYVRNCEENTAVACSHCGSVYGGRRADVEKYMREHEVCNRRRENGEAYTCCDKCIGEIRDGETAALRVRVPGEDRIRYAYAVEELKGKSELRVCGWLDELVYGKETDVCQCCGEYVSKIWLDDINGKRLCHFCLGKEHAGLSPVSARDIPSGAWRELKRSMRPVDAKREQCETVERGDLLWVYRRYSDGKGNACLNSYSLVKMLLGKRSVYLLKGFVPLRLVNGVLELNEK